MKSVKVPLKKLNDVRKELMGKELMRMDYRIKAEADYGYIPIKEDVDGIYNFINNNFPNDKVTFKNNNGKKFLKKPFLYLKKIKNKIFN